MDANLRGPYSWLALAGLFWLQEGMNPFGSGPGNAIRLPGRAPAQAGTFHLADGKVTVNLAPGVNASLNEGDPPPPGALLHNDHDADPDYLFMDDLRMLVVLRGGRPAIRLWDPQHPARMNFPFCFTVIQRAPEKTKSAIGPLPGCCCLSFGGWQM